MVAATQEQSTTKKVDSKKLLEQASHKLASQPEDNPGSVTSELKGASNAARALLAKRQK